MIDANEYFADQWIQQQEAREDYRDAVEMDLRKSLIEELKVCEIQEALNESDLAELKELIVSDDAIQVLATLKEILFDYWLEDKIDEVIK